LGLPIAATGIAVVAATGIAVVAATGIAVVAATGIAVVAATGIAVVAVVAVTDGVYSRSRPFCCATHQQICRRFPRLVREAVSGTIHMGLVNETAGLPALARKGPAQDAA
jgi:hypothetical protein